MHRIYTARVSDHARSATHPEGLGIGFVDTAPGRELKDSGRRDGRHTFLSYGPSGVGSRDVHQLMADEKGVFSIPLGTVGDALTLKIDYAGDEWHLERRFDDQTSRVLDPTGLNESTQKDVAHYVVGMIGQEAYQRGPGKEAEATARWADGRYAYTIKPRSEEPCAVFERDTTG
jgi:hypothetical protein